MAESLEDILARQMPDDDAPAAEARGWSNIWQIPVLVLGMVIFALGVYMAIPEPEADDFPAALDEVALLLKAENHEEAEQRLEAAGQGRERMTPEEHARYLMLWGDLVYQQDRARGWDNPENHRKVDQYFGQARELGQRFDPTHIQRWAEALVALDRYSDARRKLAELGDGHGERKYRVLRQIIERRIKVDADPQDVLRLIEHFNKELAQEPDPLIMRREQIWASRLKADILLNTGATDAATQAAQFLERRLLYFHSKGGSNDLSPLEVKLAQAYQSEGRFDKAKNYYLLAQGKLRHDHDALNGEILVGLGQVALAEGEAGNAGGATVALAHFARAEEGYQSTPAYIDALIGRAHTEALLGKDVEALKHFARAVKELIRPEHDDPQAREQLIKRIREHHDIRFEQGKYEDALAYLEKVKPLFQKQEELPHELLATFGYTHEYIGKQMKKRATEAGAVAGIDHADPLDSARPTVARAALNQAAANHFDWAGDYFRRYAQVVLRRGEMKDYGDKLWRAAQNYDAAERWPKAIETYRQFVDTLESDQRRLAAFHRLGLAYMAKRPRPDYAVARDLFEDLIKSHPKTPAAYDSLVPLALCYRELGKPDEARRRLIAVVNDHEALTPTSAQYRRALIELGKLYYREGQFEEAIQSLAEAVERYGDSREAPALRFFLADAYRRSTRQLDADLELQMPQSKRARLQEERTRRLTEARKLYSQAINSLEALPPDTLTALEKVFHRNAYFYRADCAFYLRHFEEARSLYEKAYKQWESHPSSLIALVQIVNTYCEMGDLASARSQNRRAQNALKQFPESAFDDPNLPMSRKHWQDWLRWTNRLNELADDRSASTLGG